MRLYRKNSRSFVWLTKGIINQLTEAKSRGFSHASICLDGHNFLFTHVHLSYSDAVDSLCYLLLNANHVLTVELSSMTIVRDTLYN